MADERNHFPFSDDWSPAYNRTVFYKQYSFNTVKLTFGVISLSGVQDDNLLERDSVKSKRDDFVTSAVPTSQACIQRGFGRFR